MPELVVAWTELMLRKARRSEEHRVVRMFWRGLVIVMVGIVSNGGCEN